MISCVIIEDEPPALQLLEDHIGKVPFLELKHSFYSGIEAFDYIKQYRIDLIFLDINLPRLNGLEFAGMLPVHTKVIFTTAYAEHALASYQFEALDYLLKPVTFTQFLQAAQRAQKWFDKASLFNVTSQYLFIKSGKDMVRLDWKDIMVIEAMKEYAKIHTPKGDFLCYKRMKEFQEQLPANFIRIHNSYIINTDHIERVADNEVYINKNRWSISTSYKEGFFTLLNKKVL